jgi:hypothetical protein
MPARLNCPQCTEAIEVADDLLGRWITCPSCEFQFAAMGSPTVGRSVVYSTPRRRQRNPMALAWVIAVILLAGALGACVFACFAVIAGDMDHQATILMIGGESYHATKVQEDAATIRHWGVFIMAIVFVTEVAHIFMLVWVARDARARGDSSAAWLLVVLFFHLIGFLVYVASRPSGRLVACSTCGNKKLMQAKLCPQCGHG